MKTLVFFLLLFSSVSFAQIQDVRADKAELSAFTAQLCSGLPSGNDSVKCYERGQNFYSTYRSADSTQSLNLFKASLTLTVCTFDQDPKWEERQAHCLENSKLLQVNAIFRGTVPELISSFSDPAQENHSVRIDTCPLSNFRIYTGLQVGAYRVDEFEYRDCLSDAFARLHTYLKDIETKQRF